MASKTLAEMLHGQTRFGRLTVEGEGPPLLSSGKLRRRIALVCDCGGRAVSDAGNLLRGVTQSCGCLRSERQAANAKRVGAANRRHGRRWTPEYAAWRAMKSRCGNLNVPAYPRYGGRGITICEAWIESFEAFFGDMGERPSPKHSLDRRDNEGNYEPGNCRWATASEQNSNRRPATAKRNLQKPPLSA